MPEVSATHKALILESAAETAPSLKEVPTRAPGPGQAAVCVHAAALNHRDVWIGKGKYADIRYPVLPGSDGSGVVDAVGPGVDGAWVGRKVIVNSCLDWGKDGKAPEKGWRILGMPDAGTFAERVLVPAANLADMPAHLSFEEAAALPLAGATAHRSLFYRGGLKAGEKVLVTGAGGGVSQFLIQFALAAGASVHVTSGSQEKLRRAIEAGAAGGANYREDGWEKSLAQSAGLFDLIVDSAGGSGFLKLCDLAAPGGRLVFFGATLGNPAELPLRKVFWRQLDLRGSTMGSPSDFAAMVALVSEKKLRPVIDRVYPAAQAAEAFARMDAGEQYGKIVLKMRD